MDKLDLHGVKHQDVDMEVENFVLMNQRFIPLTIICGNSERMKKLATAEAHRIVCARGLMRERVSVPDAGRIDLLAAIESGEREFDVAVLPRIGRKLVSAD